MIVKFSFQNFRSYKNETTFDFQAASIPEFDDSLIKRDGVSPLLPVNVVYGPNGGGKSNALMALGCLISIVSYPIRQLKKCRVNIFQQIIQPAPFVFDKDSANEPTAFDLFFRTKEYEYRYYLSIYNDEIIDECLYRKTFHGKKSAMIFERNKKDIVLGPYINKKTINTDVNPKMPYLSFLAINYDLDIIVDVQKWFESCIIMNYANPKSDSMVFLADNDKEKQIIIGLMNEMDISITDFRQNKEDKRLFTKREINGAEFELDFNEESAGTRKVFSMLHLLIEALGMGRLVIFDELDAKLHPKLLKYIIMLFKDSSINTSGAQLIFTSHDLTTMNKDIFRRDEIWFAALNDKKESEIYSLYDFRTDDGSHINNTASFSKQYLEGRYGADPYLKRIVDWEV